VDRVELLGQYQTGYLSIALEPAAAEVFRNTSPQIFANVGQCDHMRIYLRNFAITRFDWSGNASNLADSNLPVEPLGTSTAAAVPTQSDPIDVGQH
jgi:hypothetical protein